MSCIGSLHWLLGYGYCYENEEKAKLLNVKTKWVIFIFLTEGLGGSVHALAIKFISSKSK